MVKSDEMDLNVIKIPYSVILSAFNIQERNEFLRNSIGFLKEEELALLNVWKFFDGSLAFLLLATFFQWIFFMLYNQNFHPFKDIIMI